MKKYSRLLLLLAAVAIAIPAAVWAAPDPDPECVGKTEGAVCRAATSCSDAALCDKNLKCPNGPVNPNNYNGKPCESDDDACTNDVCAGGECKHQDITSLCDDGDPCTTDGCDQESGCVYVPVVCNDGNPCTIDTCNPSTGGCETAPVTDDCGDATCGTSVCGNSCGPACTTTCVPEITCPASDTVECQNGNGTNTLGAATTSCGAEITSDSYDTYEFICDVSNINTVTYTATNSDGSDSCEATLTVEDTLAPTRECGASLTVKTSQQNSLCSATLTPSATGTDACQGELQGECDTDELTLSGPGTTDATCAVTDCSGNKSASCTQSLTLIDDTPPAITCATPYVTPPGAPISWTASSAVDNCGDYIEPKVTNVDCYQINGAGKVVSKLAACKASYSGNTVSVGPSAGGVGTIIKWTVSATDESENTSIVSCMTQVQNPGL